MEKESHTNDIHQSCMEFGYLILTLEMGSFISGILHVTALQHVSSEIITNTIKGNNTNIPLKYHGISTVLEIAG